MAWGNDPGRARLALTRRSTSSGDELREYRRKNVDVDVMPLALERAALHVRKDGRQLFSAREHERHLIAAVATVHHQTGRRHVGCASRRHNTIVAERGCVIRESGRNRFKTDHTGD